MFEDRSLKLDLYSLLLVACSLLVGVSLWSYSATDPPSTLVFPPQTQVENACGRTGAYLSHYLLQGLGWGAWYLFGSLVLVLLLLVRGEMGQPLLRGVGWAASLVAISTMAAMALPDSTPGPEIGPGGYLGTMGLTLLESHFARGGAVILAVSLLVAGLLLSTDYLLLKVVAFSTVISGRGLMRLGQLGHGAVGRRGESLETDPEDPRDEEDTDEVEEEDEWEYEDDEEELEEAEEEEELETPSLKVRTHGSAHALEQREEQPGRGPSAEPAQDLEEEAGQETTESGISPLKSKLAQALKISKRAIKKGGARKEEAKSEEDETQEDDHPVLHVKKKPGDVQNEREAIISQLDEADTQGESVVDYELPSLDLLLSGDPVSYKDHEREVRKKAKVLEKTFQNFGFHVRVVEIETGPVIAQYEVELEAGLRLSKITGLADDLAIALRVPSVRIVAPIPGKNTVGIEVPNSMRQLVRMREVVEEAGGQVRRMKIPIYLGKDVSGKPMVVDLTTMPHLLIAGRTGTGKSVCLNTIIVSILMCRGPDEVRMLMIDPKMVELSGYQKLPHLMHPVVTDMRKAEAILAWGVDKMEQRYQLLARAGVRHMSIYNQLSEEELRERIVPTSEQEWEQIPRQLPFIVIVADELADLMMTSGKEVEQHIIRLAQKSRAVGIHLILATQKPTVDVITGLIKSNLPARIAFQVASRTDSRVVLDEMGADKLLGNGDMLFLSPGTSTLLRGQGTYLSDDEITRVVDFVGTELPQFAQELIELKTVEEEEESKPGRLNKRDDLYESAVDIVVREQRGSVSLLQRCLGIGYGRAARLIDYMAEDGIVGQYNGSQAREVMLSPGQWEELSRGVDPTDSPNESAHNADAPATAATAAVADATGAIHRNRILPVADQPEDPQKGLIVECKGDHGVGSMKTPSEEKLEEDRQVDDPGENERGGSDEYEYEEEEEEEEDPEVAETEQTDEDSWDEGEWEEEELEEEQVDNPDEREPEEDQLEEEEPEEDEPEESEEYEYEYEYEYEEDDPEAAETDEDAWEEDELEEEEGGKEEELEQEEGVIEESGQYADSA